MDAIKNQTGLPPTQNNPRVVQQRMLPTAVPTRILGRIIQTEPESLALGGAITGATTMADASNSLFTFTLTDAFSRMLLSTPDISIFIGSVTSANKWPNATYHMGNLPISFFPGDWGDTNNTNVVSKLILRNLTGAPVDIIVKYRTRVIINPIGSQNGTNV